MRKFASMISTVMLLVAFVAASACSNDSADPYGNGNQSSTFIVLQPLSCNGQTAKTVSASFIAYFGHT